MFTVLFSIASVFLNLNCRSIPDTGYIALEEYTAVAKMITTLVFSAAKSGFKSVIPVVCQ